MAHGAGDPGVRSLPGGSSSVPPHGPPPAPQDDLRPANPKRQTLTRRISFPSHSLPPAHLALLRRWLVCFALVDFDIDSGPNLDNAFPPTRFPETTRHNIAFSSLPEAGALPQPDDLPDGGYAYHWRIPYPAEDDLARVERDASGAEVARLPDADEADGALHGFVWFVRDKVRSRLPYPHASC